MAATDLNTVRAAIEGRIGTELASSPAIPVVYYNMPNTPTPASSWCQCLVSFGASDFLSMGGTSGSDNSVTGIVLVNIFTAKGDGSGANLTIGKRIRDLYNRIVVSGVHFDPPIGPEVLAKAAPEGYFQTQVRMTFETFEEL